jgi:mannosyltransferase
MENDHPRLTAPPSVTIVRTFFSAYLPLIFILIAGLALRLFNVSKESFWVDEGYSARLAQLSFTRIVHELMLDTHPPLYFFILHIWYLLFGNSEFILRLLSVFLGSISIFASYLIGIELFNKRTGIIAALCIALNTYLIAYSQEARMYALLACLSSFSFYGFITSLKHGTKNHLIIYFVASLLLLYTHIHGVFVVFAQSVCSFTFLLFFRNKFLLAIRNILCMQLLLGILFIPWIFAVKLQLIGRMESWMHAPTLLLLSKTFIDFSGSPHLLIVFIMLFGITVVSKISALKTGFLKRLFIDDTEYFANNYHIHATTILLIWLGTTILLPLLFSTCIFPIFKSKYAITAIFPFILLSINGLMALGNKWIKVAFIILIAGLSLLSIRTYFLTVHKDQWREAVQFLDTQAKPGDLLVFSAGYNLENIFNYYSRRTDLIKIPFPAKSVRVNCPIDEKNIHELDTLIGRFNHIWIIASQNKDDKALLAQRLADRYDFVGKKRFIGVGIYRFDLRKR